MKYIYIAWQDDKTREWLPVAKLEKTEKDYLFSYTQGASRSPNFSGLGRMNDLGKVYSSKEIFPFFKNRILSKNRPDYQKYIKWLGLEGNNYDEMELLSISSGSRATDSYEIISAPEKKGNDLFIKFFARGISHFSKSSIEEINTIEENRPIFLMQDYQNDFDKNAIALRTDNPKFLVGYIPKYYCKAIHRFIQEKYEIKCQVLQNNLEAPLNLRLLCSITVEGCANQVDSFFDTEDNFKKWSNEKIIKNISDFFQKK